MSDPSILDAIKGTVAHGRTEFARALSGVVGIVLSDEEFALARAEYAARYRPDDPEDFVSRHSVWLDVLTANGKTRIYRQSAFAGLLFQLADPQPVPPAAPSPGA